MPEVRFTAEPLRVPKNKQPRSEYRMHTAENAQLSRRGLSRTKEDTDSAIKNRKIMLFLSLRPAFLILKTSL